MKSILVLSEKYWPYGGAELATHLILKLLRNEGFSLTVVTGTRRLERIKDVKYFYSSLLDVPSKIHLWANLLRLRSEKWLNELILKNDIVYITRFAYPLIPLVKEYEKKAIVHLHNYQPITYCSVIFDAYDEKPDTNLFHELKKSLQFEILENESSYKALLSSLATPLNRLSRLWISEADEVICVSERQANIVKWRALELARKVKVIYNPLPNVQYVDKDVDEPSFLYVGGSSFCKGAHILAKALTKFLKRYKCKIVLTKITSGRWRPLFEKINKVFQNSLSIYGRIDYGRLLNMYSQATALLFPSVWEEPLPYSILEAMLAGTVPIASKTGGVPEIVQGTIAEKMLFTPSNVDELVDRMEAALSLSNKQLIDIGLKLRQEVLRKFREEELRKVLLRVFSL